ncbi:MAG TPA: hypothetical protein PLF13_08795 [candidate division Zixibacteria bacterium]|nr:hypothetical protein [candidate division Zixibacteria bacterium]
MFESFQKAASVILAVGLLGLGSIPVSVSAQHRGHDFPQPGSFHVPPVAYRLQMQAFPDSGFVSGRIEITFRNDSNDTLTDVCLGEELPLHIRTRRDSQRPEPDSVDAGWLAELDGSRSGYCLIDSLLFQGVPLTVDQIELNDNVIRIHLPVLIRPNETAFFMGTIRSRSGNKSDENGPVSFNDWFPKIVEFGEDSVWINGKQGLEPKGPLLGRFTVSIAVDSSWDMVAPGELVNEKEIFGLFPSMTEDSVYVDLFNAHQLTYLGRRYTPEFEGGWKRFFVRLENEYYLPLVFAPRFIRDRTVVDGVVLDVCYSPDQAEVWGGHGISVAKKILERYDRNFGPPPHAALRFVAGDYMDYTGPFGSLFTLDPDTTFLVEGVIRSIAESYLMPAFGPYYDILTREPWDLLQFMQIAVAPEMPYQREPYETINFLGRHEKAIGHEMLVSVVRDFLTKHRYGSISYNDVIEAVQAAIPTELNTDTTGSSDN